MEQMNIPSCRVQRMRTSGKSLCGMVGGGGGVGEGVTLTEEISQQISLCVQDAAATGQPGKDVADAHTKLSCPGRCRHQVSPYVAWLGEEGVLGEGVTLTEEISQQISLCIQDAASTSQSGTDGADAHTKMSCPEDADIR